MLIGLVSGHPRKPPTPICVISWFNSICQCRIELVCCLVIPPTISAVEQFEGQRLPGRGRRSGGNVGSLQPRRVLGRGKWVRGQDCRNSYGEGLRGCLGMTIVGVILLCANRVDFVSVPCFTKHLLGTELSPALTMITCPGLPCPRLALPCPACRPNTCHVSDGTKSIGKSTRTYLSSSPVISYPTLKISTTDYIYRNQAVSAHSYVHYVALTSSFFRG